jgi:autoinducer-2 kinase
MAFEYLLALDAGTSAFRCLIFDLHGKLASLSRREYVYHYPADAAPLGKELVAEELWETVCECILSALKAARINPGDLAGISAASQREGTVFLDREGRELYLGPNIDLRAVAEGLVMDNRYAAEIQAITGHLPSLLFVPARLKWYHNNHPEIFSRVSAVLSFSDWLLFRLCGEMACEVCGTVESGLADVARRNYSTELWDLLELPSSIFPAAVCCGTRIGRVTAGAAAETGLAENTPVVQGAPDSHCGLLGMGIGKIAEVGIVSGWSTPLQMVTGAPVFDASRRIWTGCHPFQDKWILESNCGETGHSLEWVRTSLFGLKGLPEGAGYDLMNSLAMPIPAGSEGVLAYSGPEAMDCGNLGLRWGGFIFPLPFSATNVSSAQLCRAAFENIGYALRANLEQLEAVAGQKPGDIRLGGGLGRSACLKQLLPGVLARPTAFASVTETSGLGAAMLAAAGCGIYSGPEEAVSAMLSPLEILEPDPLTAAEYEDYYQRWLSISRRLKEIGEELN